MKRLSAAKTAFQNPEKVTVSIPVIKMTPDKPRELREDQTDEQKLLTQIIFNRFISVMKQQPDDEDRSCLDYGYKLLQQQSFDKESYLHYSMLWPMFFAGVGAGMEFAWVGLNATQRKND